MKHIGLTIGIAGALLASCTFQEVDTQKASTEEATFYASFEQPTGHNTRLYADENLYLRWTADDRVSIFNRITYNQQYRFLGETGDNAGEYAKVESAEFVSGNAIPNIVSVYPYQTTTKITEEGVLSVVLPSEIDYAKDTFGQNANTMVSESTDNVLLYKNVGGYLKISLYGDGISISSIKLEGNNGEKIAGKAEITMSLDGVPSVKMSNEATAGITLFSKSPVVLGSSAEKSTAFWFVLPPVTFSRGFSITVKRNDGTAFTKSTSNIISISRNNISTMSPFKVEMESRQPNNVIYYTTSDGNIAKPGSYASFDATIVSNTYVDGIGVMTFDGDVTRITRGFENCSNLTSISLPESITNINGAFYQCNSLSSVILPESITDLGVSTFYRCYQLTDIRIPASVVRIGSSVFSDCTALTSITIPNGVIAIDGFAFNNCTHLSEVVLPESVTSVGEAAFMKCTSLTSIVIPNNVASIGYSAFQNCSNLKKIEMKPLTPPSGGNNMFSGVGLGHIYVPFESLEAYKTAEGWKQYSKSIIGTGITSLFYTTIDGQLCKPTNTIFNAELLSNDYVNGVGTMTFDGIVSEIEQAAFSQCSNLKSVTIPESVTIIGKNAFAQCPNLISVTIHKNVNMIGLGAFRNCPRITDIYLPETITSVGEYTFDGCTSLASIILPETLTTIDQYAFRNCSGLTSISVPATVTTIGHYAFQGCTNLERINVKPFVPPIGGEKMFNNTGLCPIYISAGSEEAYANADFWKPYVLRMRVEGSNSSIGYSSSDYSHDGEVIQLQHATVGRGVNIIFMGDGFLDKDMGSGGKYEQKMNEAMEQFFAYEPYYSFRNRFNIYAVKVVSKNDIYGDESSERALTYEENDSFYFRTGRTDEYGAKVPNPYKQPMSICTVCNTDIRLGRSWCFWYGTSSCFIMDKIGPVLNHELGGHAFGLLLDEYVEFSGLYTDNASLDELYETSGRGANVDWRSDPETVRWARFLNDSRYQYEGLGVFEGGYRYAHGVYRPTQDSMMNHNETPFNAPSREQIYKFIMKYSEGDDWVYNYEEFVKADERGRMEAAEELGPWNSPRRSAKIQSREEFHCPPITIDKTVKAVGMNKDGDIIIVQ